MGGEAAIICVTLLSFFTCCQSIHLTQKNLHHIAQFVESASPINTLSRLKRQAITDPQPWYGPVGQQQVLAVPIPTNIGFFPGGNQTVSDACARDQIQMEYGGSCEYPLTQGICELNEEIILNPETNRGICVPRLCPPDRVFLPSTQLCHDPLEMNICPSGRELYYSAHGTPVCTCPDGTVEGDDDFDDDVCEVILSSSLQCMPGQVFWFQNFNSPPACQADPCGGQNLQRAANELPFVPTGAGSCLQLGSSSGVCPDNQYFSLSYESLTGKCATLEEAGYVIFDATTAETLTNYFADAVASPVKAPAATNLVNGAQIPSMQVPMNTASQQNSFNGQVAPSGGAPSFVRTNPSQNLHQHSSTISASSPDSSSNNVLQSTSRDPSIKNVQNKIATNGGSFSNQPQNVNQQNTQSQSNVNVDFSSNSVQTPSLTNEVRPNQISNTNIPISHSVQQPSHQYTGNTGSQQTGPINSQSPSPGNFFQNNQRQYHDEEISLPGQYHDEEISLPGQYHDEEISLPGQYHDEEISLPGQYHDEEISLPGQSQSGSFNSEQNFGNGQAQSQFPGQSHTASQMHQPQFSGYHQQNDQQASLEFGGPGFNSPEVFGNSGNSGNNQQSIEVFDPYYGMRLARSLGVSEIPRRGRLAAQWELNLDGSIVSPSYHSRRIRDILSNDDFLNLENQSNSDRQVRKLSRRKRDILPYASPSNVFETRLLGCRPGAVRDINAKCRKTILPARIPKRRGTRGAPPIPPTPSCGRGMAFNIRRRCVPSRTAQNSIVAFNLG